MPMLMQPGSGNEKRGYVLYVATMLKLDMSTRQRARTVHDQTKAVTAIL